MTTLAPVAAVAGVFGLCCGLPVLVSIGAFGAITGWSLQSWGLIGLGLAVTTVGGAQWAKRRRGPDTPCRTGLSARESVAPDAHAHHNNAVPPDDQPVSQHPV